MILLFLVALPPTFAEFAILGYIDFVSIIIAIGITIIATGIKAGDSGLGKSSLKHFRLSKFVRHERISPSSEMSANTVPYHFQAMSTGRRGHLQT